ncbi:relaxase/mobilization nuclease domain-containing protein [Mucilaginibacter kameinonensis]|uniref:relaxase/mobilization nuclease domain-containing protein n=1 Tax=Mucilaginibacter kameinonensis TaxID=452286 RepID=UPI000EF8232D|nr:relaxase/mobilization nuclease domain-containing protein [Mucilaginibacter kameinonensis]
MVAKFLNSNSSFNGVSYNTNKMDKDKGELMKTENFGYLQGIPNVMPEEYKNYLRSWSNTNSSIRDKQMHLVLSAEGREYDKGQLTDMADAFMKAMGYGENPYMVVFHNDTANNHVHIVSSRIDHNGAKIDDSFEHKRAMEVMQRIINNDIKYATIDLVQKTFDYSISTVAQFKLLFEQQGYSVFYNDNGMTLRKYDDIQQIIPMQKVNSLIAESKKDDGRMLQLKAIINKYKGRADATVNTVYEPSKFDHLKKPIGYTSDLSKLLKQMFDIDIVYHGKDGKPPYGYTIIDHKSNSVFKGSEIMPLKEFIDNTLLKTRQTKTNEPIRLKVDGFKEKEASTKIFGGSLGMVSFATIPAERLALINVLLKSSLHEFNFLNEGLSYHKMELHSDNKGLFILDRSNNILIDAKRVLSPSDYALMARRSGLRLPQKEKELIIKTDTSNAYSLKGILKNHGAANYQFEKDAKPSYFIELLKQDGKPRIVWGLDLERAIQESGYKVGELVQLNYKGYNEVQIQVPVKDAEGATTHYENKLVKRNDWEVSAPDERSETSRFQTQNVNDQSAASSGESLYQQESALLDAIIGFELSIADDIDDEQINGRNRRREKKARINTR